MLPNRPFTATERRPLVVNESSSEPRLAWGKSLAEPMRMRSPVLPEDQVKKDRSQAKQGRAWLSEPCWVDLSSRSSEQVVVDLCECKAQKGRLLR